MEPTMAADAASPYRRILLATDMSTAAEDALREARRLTHPDAEVLVVHVALPLRLLPYHMRASERRAFERARAEADRELEAQLRTHAARVGVPDASVRLLEGSVAREVATAAEEWRADLVAVGARGHTVAERVLLGSKARVISRESPCDVLVARAGGDGRGPLVAATDFSDFARLAAARAATLAASLGRPLALAHVDDPRLQRSHLGLDEDLLPDAAAGGGPGWHERAVREMLRRVNDDLGHRAEEVMLSGDPVHGLVSFARDRDASLVVVGASGEGALGRLVFGSVAEGVAERAPCPVLVVKR
jgi:universal stress protein E